MTYIPSVNGGRINATISGNTAGAGSLISSGTLSLAGGNNITLSQNGNAITISGAAGGGAGSNTIGMSNLGNTSGTSGVISGSALQYAFAGGNNITLSQSINASSGTVTISAAAQSVQTQNLYNLTLSGNTAGVMAQVSSGTLTLAGGNNITLSQNGNAVTISGGAGGGGGATLSRFEYPEGLFTSLGSIGLGSLSFNHMYVPFNVTGTAAKIGGSLLANTNTSATTASANMSLWMGIYTLNGSTLSLASSGSANNGYQWSQSASTTGNTSLNGMRQLTVPMNVNMTPGEYWMAAVVSSATTYTNVVYTIYGNSQVASGASNAVLSPIGSTASRDVMLFQGIYTAATNVGPTSVGSAAINNTAISNVQRANFYNVIYNATY